MCTIVHLKISNVCDETWNQDYKSRRVWGTVPSVGNVAQPPLGKASGERGWLAGPTSMDRFSSGESGLHGT